MMRQRSSFITGHRQTTPIQGEERAGTLTRPTGLFTAATPDPVHVGAFRFRRNPLPRRDDPQVG